MTPTLIEFHAGLRFAAHAWGEGPLVLLLHGFPDTAHTWDGIGPALAQRGYRVVAPFLRGYAPSAIPHADADARTLGGDVLAMIGALGADGAIVIGHDWGAESAYAAVAIEPSRVKKLVTVAIPHRAAVQLTPRLLWALRHFFTLKMPGASARFARDDFAMIEVLWRRWSPTWRYSASDLAPVKQTFGAPGSLDAALGYYRAAEIITPRFMRARVTVPTLCVAGRDDPGAPLALFEGAARQFARGYEVRAIGGGHFCHRESPGEFLDAVVPFLGEP